MHCGGIHDCICDQSMQAECTPIHLGGKKEDVSWSIIRYGISVAKVAFKCLI